MARWPRQEMHVVIAAKTLSRFLRDSPIALTLASPAFEDLPLVMANDAFLRLTGFTREDVLGRNCRFMQGPQSEQKAISELRQSIADQREACVAVTNYRRDGTRFKNLVFVFPIFDKRGQLVYMMGSQYDVTAPQRTVSPSEYGEILDEVIGVNRPLTNSSEHVMIGNSRPCVEAIRDILHREP